MTLPVRSLRQRPPVTVRDRPLGHLQALTGTIVVAGQDYPGERLRAWASELRALLQTRIASHSRVVIALSHPAAFAASVVAVRSLGAVPVLLSSRARAALARDRDQMLKQMRDCQPHLVILDEAHLAVLGPQANDLGAGLCHIPHALGAPIVTEHLPVPLLPGNPDGAALIVYTSGSHSGGRGVVLSEDNLDYLLRMNQLVNGWRPDDCLLAALPLSHLAGFLNLMGACRGGARVVASPPFMWIADVIDTCIAERVTVIGLVPYYLGLLVRGGHLSALDSLRLVVCSAAPIRERDVHSALAAVPGLQIVNAYGLTEAFRSLVRAADCPTSHIAALGVPMPDISVQLRDAAGAPLKSPAARGTAWIRGPNVMLGYWNRPEDTRTCLRDGWLCTGDILSCTPDGHYWLEGRRADVLNGGGEKLAAQLVEHHIARSCPVAEVCVIGNERMTGIDEVIAVVVPDAGARVSLSDIRQACAGRMHSAFVPGRLILVAGLPRTASGKIARRQVSQLAS